MNQSDRQETKESLEPRELVSGVLKVPRCCILGHRDLLLGSYRCPITTWSPRDMRHIGLHRLTRPLAVHASFRLSLQHRGQTLISLSLTVTDRERQEATKRKPATVVRSEAILDDRCGAHSATPLKLLYPESELRPVVVVDDVGTVSREVRDLSANCA